MASGDHTENGLMRWLADRFSAVEWRLGELHAGQQVTFKLHKAHAIRMDRIEDRLRNGKTRRPIPWSFIFKILLLLSAVLLIVTGHLTVSEIKQFLARRLLE